MTIKVQSTPAGQNTNCCKASGLRNISNGTETAACWSTKATLYTAPVCLEFCMCTPVALCWSQSESACKWQQPDRDKYDGQHEFASQLTKDTGCKVFLLDQESVLVPCKALHLYYLLCLAVADSDLRQNPCCLSESAVSVPFLHPSASVQLIWEAFNRCASGEMQMPCCFVYQC